MKNPTPLQVVIVSSLLLAVSVLVSAWGYQYLVFSDINIQIGIYLFVFTGVISFVIFFFMLQWFIYRKIKVIYKSIYDFKVSKDKTNTGKINMASDVFEHQAQDVEQWAATKREEIEKLRQLEVFRKEFLANVSHELKTPLFNIQGYIETLIDGGLDDPTINTSYLKKASENVSRMNSIIKDLETITSLETGQIQLNITSFRINDVISGVFEALSYQAKAKRISLKFKKSCSTGFVVEADKEKIREVLFNLISNSIRYGKEGGETQVGCYDMEQNLLIEVSDNGIGIAKEHLPHLFERFYRVDKDRSRISGGTGLGLSIVKHIVEAHKQSVHVRSTIGIGTTFGFTLKKYMG